MPKKIIKDPNNPLTMEVAYYWPLMNLKEIYITDSSKDAWRNTITLNKEQAYYLYDQLGAILPKRKEQHENQPEPLTN